MYPTAFGLLTLSLQYSTCSKPLWYIPYDFVTIACNSNFIMPNKKPAWASPTPILTFWSLQTQPTWYTATDLNISSSSSYCSWDNCLHRWSLFTYLLKSGLIPPFSAFVEIVEEKIHAEHYMFNTHIWHACVIWYSRFCKQILWTSLLLLLHSLLQHIYPEPLLSMSTNPTTTMAILPVTPHL